MPGLVCWRRKCCWKILVFLREWKRVYILMEAGHEKLDGSGQQSQVDWDLMWDGEEDSLGMDLNSAVSPCQLSPPALAQGST